MNGVPSSARQGPNINKQRLRGRDSGKEASYSRWCCEKRFLQHRTPERLKFLPLFLKALIIDRSLSLPLSLPTPLARSPLYQAKHRSTQLSDTTDDEVRRKLEQQLKRREDASTPTTTGDGDDEGNDSLDVDDADARCGALAPRRDPSRPGGDGPLRLALGYPDQLRRSL